MAASVQGDPSIVLFVIFLFVAVFFFVGFRALKMKRIIEGTPTSKIRSAAIGLAEINGKVSVYKNAIKSPFAQKDCVYYKYEIRHKNNKMSRYGASGTKFLLKDETGSMLVDPDMANVSKSDAYFELLTSSGADIPDHIKKFLSTLPMTPTDWSRYPPLKFREYLIEPGDELYVLGTIESVPATDANEPIVTMKQGEANKIYIISDKPEMELVKRYKAEAIGALTASFICALALIASVLNIVVV
jgi:hypothetical protein